MSIASAIYLPHDIIWYNGLSGFKYMVFDISQDIANILNLTLLLMKIHSFQIFRLTFGPLE